MTATGATHYRWRKDVALIVGRVQRRWPEVTANTYVDHPWPGWDHVSVDFWGRLGRGWPIPREDGREIRHYLMELPGQPLIRHLIYGHMLWTSFGGDSFWQADDHAGKLRHLHVTYWK